jgi:hypothetical protein
LSPLPFVPFLPNLLRRVIAPRPAEITNWVNSSIDLLAIEIAFAGSGEFYSNG